MGERTARNTKDKSCGIIVTYTRTKNSLPGVSSSTHWKERKGEAEERKQRTKRWEWTPLYLVFPFSRELWWFLEESEGFFLDSGCDKISHDQVFFIPINHYEFGTSSLTGTIFMTNLNDTLKPVLNRINLIQGYYKPSNANRVPVYYLIE